MSSSALVAAVPLIFNASGAWNGFSDSLIDAAAYQTSSITSVRLEHGRNSLSEPEARRRLEDYGLVDIGPLVLDGFGIWRTTATLGAMTVNVGMDHRGKITTEDAGSPK